MTNKDLEFFKINLDSYAMYMVEYIPNLGAKEFSVI